MVLLVLYGTFVKIFFFFLNVCRISYSQQDLNTVWLIYCVVTHFITLNPNIKLHQKHKKLLENIKKEFGNSNNYLKNHIEHIFNFHSFLPSLMLVEIQRKRFKKNNDQHLHPFFIYYK